MKKFFAKICRKNGIAKRIVSMSLALLMVLSTLQALPAGILVTHAEEPGHSVTIHWNNSTSNWSSANVYAWGQTGLPGWPGSAMSPSKNKVGWYDITLTGITVETLNFICNGNGGTFGKTKDLNVGIGSTDVEIWVEDAGADPESSEGAHKATILTEAPDSWTNAETPKTVTIHWHNDVSQWTSAKLYAWTATQNPFTEAWAGDAMSVSEVKDGWFDITLSGITDDTLYFIPNGVDGTFGQTENLSVTVDSAQVEVWIIDAVANPESAEGKYNATVVTEEPEEWTNSADAVVGANVTVHWYNDVSKWASANLYAWNTEKDPIKAWPGDAMSVSTVKRGWYDCTLKNVPGETLNFICNSSGGTFGQTENLSLTIGDSTAVEVWVTNAVLNPESNEGKYNATVATEEPAEWTNAAEAIKSPVVNGNKVTFTYEDLTGKLTQPVYLRGSMTDWEKSQEELEYKDDDKVYSCTLTLAPGKYEYKFWYDDTSQYGCWFTDPKNASKTSGDNPNSIVIVSGIYSSETLAVEKGKNLELSSTLAYVDADGNSANPKAVTYELADDYEGVTLTDKILAVEASCELTSVDVVATATDGSGLTATLTVKLNEAGVVVVKSPVVKKGQVTFNYKAEEGFDKNLYLRGDMNGWAANQTKLTDEDGDNVYSCTLTLTPGTYYYKFWYDNGEKDGCWFTDPLNSQHKDPNNKNSDNVVVVIGSPVVDGNQVTFNYEAEEGFDKNLYLRGSMNDWAANKTQLTDEDGDNVYSCTLTLTPGTYYYKFWYDNGEKDGCWFTDPLNSQHKTPDEENSDSVVVVRGSIESPVVNGNQVTFKYEGEATTVSAKGSWNAWTEAVVLKKGDDGIWTGSTELAPGKYGYKLIVDDKYIFDPNNEDTIYDGKNDNSLLVVTGLSASNTLVVQRGEGYTLPTQLNCVNESGDSVVATVTWALKNTEDSYVTLADGKLTAKAGCTENSVVLVATTGTISSDVTIKICDKVYTYTIYTYSPIASKVDASKYSLWIWDNAKTSGHPDENYAFTGTQVIGGKTWLKTEVRLPYADSLGIIFRTKEDWTWQSENMLYSNKNKENQTLYIVDGIEKVFTEIEDATVSYMTIEYTRGDGAYTNPYVEAWWNGYSYNEDGKEKNYTYDFEVVNGKYIATVPVALGDEDMKVGFNVWNNGVIDGDAQTITIKAGEKLTKVKFANGIITNIVPASTSYVIKHKEGSLAGKISFYYRDEALFAANNMHSINKVELVTRTKVGDGNISDETRYTMVYDSENERFELEDQTLVADSEIYYYFVVNETTTKLDVKNNRTVNIGGTDYSLIRNRAFDVQLIADVEYDSMTYNDGNVIYLTWSAKTEGADISGFNPEKIYVDLSSLGLGNKVEMDIELNALSFGCLEGTKTGEKTIKVTVLDDCDLEYTTTTTVNVTARNKGTDFDWDEAVIYFAVTDRFFDGNEDNNDGNPNATVNDPSFNKNERGSYHGGDFAGLTKKMGYLADLGVNTIWLTPIVDNVDGNYDNGTADCDYYAYHGYWADDFTKLNSHLGTEEEFKALIDAAHAKGIKIMVDVVINHSGYDTKGLQVFNGMHRTETLGNEIQKELDGLPDFLTEDPEVRAQIINWQTDWMKKYDIDYYRIDTVKHVDNTTWNAFKNELVKANQDFKIIGEYWDASYLNDYDQLDTGRMDSVLDFAFSGIMMKLVNNDLAGVEAALAERNTLLSNTATVGSFTSSHDQDGLLTKFKSENPDWAEALMKVAATFQITAKGQPIIYYGEEIGMSGLNNWPYYTNRLDFDWDELEEQKLDENSMYNHYKTMLNIRRDYSEVFAKGTRNAITADSNLGYEVFSRSYEGKTLYVGVNVHGTDRQATFYVPGATGTVYTDLYSKNTYKVAADGSITVTIPKASNGGTAVLYSSSATVVDKDEITLKVHYSRPDGDYTGWNLWAWEEGLGGAQYNFELVNGERIATYSGIPGRATSKIAYIIRKSTAGNAWAQKDVDADQWIDVSTILSGTVHYYVNAGTGGGTIVLGSDVVVGSKLVSAEYNRKNNTVVVTLSQVLAGSAADAFTMKCATTNTAIGITSIEKNGSQYTLSLDTDISDFKTLLENTYTITFDGITRNIIVPNIYATQEFEDAYTYTGNDLGLTYTSSASTFKLWAPTANSVKVNVYESGTKGTDDLINSYPMVRGEKGVWSYTLPGDWNGKYYTYTVDVANAVNEVCDPYARTTGVNGNRAMILNLDSTDPTGWDADETRWKNSLHKNMNYTDAVIYELHVRDLTIDDSSGVNDAYQGKFMGLTQTGTKTGEGYSTALDHMINLGITHLHLIPVYDYGSVDETKLDTPQYNWGYDPVNYNVPEGSYSTNPYDGSVRVKEMKQMVKTLHDNNINVVMDVVYNHVYDAGSFSFNLVVPKYFSRTNADGTYSNGSGCGNDTASERSMVRKYIVDSILYWHEEYHIDGFRFDLVGLIDADTINQIVAEVHAKDKDIIFYGEGWTMNTAAEPGTIMATQANSTATNDFAFFNDTMRNGIAGNNDANGYGVVFGNLDRKDAEKLEAAYLGRYEWCKTPSETINYASCHDNYTLMDKINIAYADDTGTQPMTSYNQEPGIEQVKLNNLSAAYYMFAQGIPLVHAGEDMLRTKFDEKGEIIHNSYNSSDYVNKIRWSNLDTYDVYADTVEYYKGLIAFRKNHEAIRLAQPGDVSVNVKSYLIDNGQVMLYSFAPTSGEVSDGIITIYNAKTTDVQINIYDSDYSSLNITSGDWYVCVNADDAGTKLLAKVGSDGKVTVKSRSAMALVKIKSAETASYKVGDDLVDTDSVYTRNNVVTLKFADNQKDGITTGVNGVVALKATTNIPATLTWVSSNTNVATVDAKGRVTAVAEGSATITVSTYHGVEATCVVTVTSETVEESIAIDKTELSLVAGESDTLVITISPAGTTATYESSDESVATIDETGKVTAVAAGSATVKATLANGQSVSCTVTVEAAPEQETVSLSKDTMSLEEGDSEKLVAVVTPAGTTVTFSSKNTNVATVDQYGNVTAVAEGSAEIIVVTSTGKTAICTVTVTKPESNQGGSEPGVDEPEPSPSEPEPTPTPNPVPSTPDSDSTTGAGNGAAAGVNPGATTTKPAEPTPTTPATPAAPTTPKVEEEEEATVEVKTEAETEVPETVEEVIPVVDEKLQNAIANETEKILEDVLNEDVSEEVMTEETLEKVKEALENGDSIITEIIVDKLDEADVKAEVKEAFEKVLAESFKDKKGAETKIVQYLDLSVLLKTTQGQELGAIHKLSKEMTFTIAVPEDLVKDGRTFVVLRMHEGVTTVLDTLMNADGTLSFKTDRFSEYALAYVDAQPEDATDDAEGTEGDVPSGATTTEEDGDNMTTFVVVGLVIVILVALAGIFFALKRKKNN